MIRISSASKRPHSTCKGLSPINPAAPHSEARSMKKRLFRNLLHVLALGLMLSYSSVGVFAASSATDAGAGFDSEWRLKVDGSVNNPLSLSINDLAAMPQTVVYAELYIYGNLVASGNWGGVRLQLLLEKAAC